MIEREFDYVLKEYFDISNRKSIRTLLSLNEADQNQVMLSLAAKLYEKIITKVDDIDFGTIPASKGNITNIGNFQEMRDCMNTIREILIHYKQDTTQLDIIDRSIENLKASKKIWEKAYAIDCQIPIVFYNTIALSIVSGISLLITSSIDFIKEPGNQSFEISFDRTGYHKSKDKILFKNLDKFNKSYIKGDIEKVMLNILKANPSVKESMVDEAVITTIATGTFIALAGIAAAGGVVFILLHVVIPVLHELVNVLYCARQNVSEYFDVQAKIVQFNAENLKYNYTKSDSEIKKIYDRQIKIVDKFKNISSKFAVKMSKAESDANKMIEKEKKEKYNTDDLAGTVDVPALTSSIF